MEPNHVAELTGGRLCLNVERNLVLQVNKLEIFSRCLGFSRVPWSFHDEAWLVDDLPLLVVRGAVGVVVVVVDVEEELLPVLPRCFGISTGS